MDEQWENIKYFGKKKETNKLTDKEENEDEIKRKGKWKHMFKN